jgi:HEAT repeat protein
MAAARQGQLGSSDIEVALADPDPDVRREACRLSADHGEVDLAPMLLDSDPLVVEMAAWALGEQGAVQATARLVTVAQEHEDPLCREAAVAALGALGDPAGLEAVLKAMRDKPQIRRRAVLALANFEGQRVEEALELARLDRDWQVRDAATALMGPILADMGELDRSPGGVTRPKAADVQPPTTGCPRTSASGGPGRPGSDQPR